VLLNWPVFDAGRVIVRNVLNELNMRRGGSLLETYRKLALQQGRNADAILLYDRVVSSQLAGTSASISGQVVTKEPLRVVARLYSTFRNRSGSFQPFPACWSAAATCGELRKVKLA
jgi:hypothetical protein